MATRDQFHALAARVHRTLPKTHHLSGAAVALCVVALGVQAVRFVRAAPPGSDYAPGEILAPTCAPGSSHCTVTPPAVSGANGDITSLSGLTSLSSAATTDTPAATFTFNGANAGFNRAVQIEATSAGLGSDAIFGAQLIKLSNNAADLTSGAGQYVLLNSTHNDQNQYGVYVIAQDLGGLATDYVGGHELYAYGAQLNGRGSSAGEGQLTGVHVELTDTSTGGNYLADMTGGYFHVAGQNDATQIDGVQIANEGSVNGDSAINLQADGAHPWNVGISLGNTITAMRGGTAADMNFEVQANQNFHLNINGDHALTVDSLRNVVNNAGEADASYQYAAPNDGDTVIIGPDTRRLVIWSIATLPGLTVSLPTANLVDGQLVGFSTSKEITALHVNGGSASVDYPDGTMAAHTSLNFIYRQTLGTWYLAP